jgi:N-acetylglucosamine-6-phosphate deacetylase
MSNQLLLKNCRIPSHTKEEKNINILIGNNIIKEISTVDIDSDCENILDANGRFLVPGFIDVHIQGAGGADVLDGKLESLKTISKTCARFGTTSFLATTVFRPDGDNTHLELSTKATGTDLGGANLLGVHIEGPFISLEKKGMISTDCICPASSGRLKEILNFTKGSLKMMTIAPELNGNLDLINELKGSGIIASFGHSNASYEETVRGIEAGISHVTHFFNTMLPLHHRNPGPILAIFEAEKVSAQIIPDGVHLHKGILKFVFNILGSNRCIIITDGMQAMGLPEGEYIYNNLKYTSQNGTARYRDGTLIGTSLGLNQLILRFMKFTGCNLHTAIQTVTKNPARLLGIDNKKGSVEAGKDADLVILDNDYSVWVTIAGGKVVYQK